MDQAKRKVEIEDRRAAAQPDAPEDTGAAALDAAAADGAGTDAPDWMAQAAAHLELAQRKEAELRNYVQRARRDVEDARRFAVEGLLADLFPALDALSQAAGSLSGVPDGDNALLDGVRGTIRLLRGALARHGLTPIGETGVPFDGHLHQALSVEPSTDVDSDTVAEVYAEGYRLGEHVLKPALVRVLQPSEE